MLKKQKYSRPRIIITIIHVKQPMLTTSDFYFYGDIETDVNDIQYSRRSRNIWDDEE